MVSLDANCPADGAGVWALSREWCPRRPRASGRRQTRTVVEPNKPPAIKFRRLARQVKHIDCGVYASQAHRGAAAQPEMSIQPTANRIEDRSQAGQAGVIKGLTI